MRNNQNNFKKQPYIFRKSKKKIETLFSQLCDQFIIRRNYAKSFEGFKSRILSKITALTVVHTLTSLSLIGILTTMKNVMKILLLAIVLGLGFTSCTAESLDEDTIEAIATDPNKKDPTPPTDPNG